MKSEKNLFKPLCIGLLFCAFVYGLVLPFMWGNNPASELGTLSLLCEDRKGWFWLWGILTSGSLIMSTQYMYKSYKIKNKWLDGMCALGFVSMCLIAFTLGHSIEDWNPKRIAHWVATGAFIVFTMAPIAIFFIVYRKRFEYFNIFTVCTFIILGTFIVIFAFVGKSALMEMIPIALMEVFMFIVNFTPLVKKKEKELIKA